MNTLLNFMQLITQSEESIIAFFTSLGAILTAVVGLIIIAINLWRRLQAACAGLQLLTDNIEAVDSSPLASRRGVDGVPLDGTAARVKELTAPPKNGCDPLSPLARRLLEAAVEKARLNVGGKK